MVTHHNRLQTIGESSRTVVDRIARVWGRATASDVESGARWYADGEMFVNDLARQTGHTRETVAAVVAHLSPRTRWSRNLYGATMLLTTDSAPTCLTANVRRARVALASSAPLGTLNGPKTRRFAANLLGDRDAVTVDVWAARVALGERDDTDNVMSRVGIYDALENSYRLAARRFGVDPTTVQATTWIVARNGRAN